MRFATLCAGWLMGGGQIPSVSAPLPANQPPVTRGDTAAALQGQTVSIAVLANDSDPEGTPLRVTSAVADQGMVVVAENNTLSYTAPQGFVGDDMIIYEIADTAGETSEGDVRVTVTQSVLAANMEPDGTISLDIGGGMLSISVQSPAAFVGTYEVNTADLVSGPVVLVPPAIVGGNTVGETLAAQNSLWIYDSVDGLPDKAFQWTRDGVDITGQTNASYDVLPADAGTTIGLHQTASNSAGAQTVFANELIAISA